MATFGLRVPSARLVEALVADLVDVDPPSGPELYATRLDAMQLSDFDRVELAAGIASACRLSVPIDVVADRDATVGALVSALIESGLDNPIDGADAAITSMKEAQHE